MIRTNSLRTAASASSRYCGFRPSVTSSPVTCASTDSDARACSLPEASIVTLSVVKVNRSGADRSRTSDTRRTASMQLRRVDHRVVLGLLGEQPAHGREVALDEQGRDGLVARGEGDDLPIARSGERDRDVAAVGERLSDLLQRPCGDEGVRAVFLRGRSAVPGDVAERDAVAVGGDEAQLGAAHLELDAREHRGDIVAGGRERHLGDRGREVLRRERDRTRR